MSAAQQSTPSHQWRFFRSGGFDQVRIDTADDLRHLGELDQKLWSVLACPTSGLEIDSHTLRLLDRDGDGMIRAPEVVAAVRWMCDMLADPGVLFQPGDSLPLSAFDTTHPEAARLQASARQVLAYVDRADADSIALSDVADTTRLFAPEHFNGDGIVPVALAPDERLAHALGRMLECMGGETDRSGEPGIGEATVEAFFNQAQALSDWQAQADGAPNLMLPLGDATPHAAAVFDALRGKVDDYFTRCRLAAYDERAAQALNPQEAAYMALSGESLDGATEGIAALPLARIGANRPLPLDAGLNPAWAERIARLRDEVVLPVLGPRDALSLGDWEDLSARFGAYRAWSAGKPTLPVAVIPVDELRTLLADGTREALLALIARDREANTAATQVEALERLLHYRRDLVMLLRNFVNLSDFYSARCKAIFQAGTLYLDQRSCELCLRVSDMDRHAALAPLSGSYLAYCRCTRQGEAPINIVAAITGGDADEMMVPGRNGVFYDRQGRDWSASVVKVVENPISVRQAFWSPYKRIGRMIGEQLQKFAAARDKSVDEQAASGIAEAGKQAAAPAVPAQPFDIARFAGIFAAIGLALGALGTALAAVVSGLLSLPPWQMPLVLLGIVLLVSGPSVLLAWFKLRQRNLGPLLDANGWAVNTRARINIPFGGALTAMARLPAGAARTLSDPYAEKRTPWRGWLMLGVAIALGWAAWQQGWMARVLPFAGPETQQTEPAQPASPAPAGEAVSTQ